MHEQKRDCPIGYQDCNFSDRVCAAGDRGHFFASNTHGQSSLFLSLSLSLSLSLFLFELCLTLFCYFCVSVSFSLGANNHVSRSPTVGAKKKKIGSTRSFRGQTLPSQPVLFLSLRLRLTRHKTACLVQQKRISTRSFVLSLTTIPIQLILICLIGKSSSTYQMVHSLMK